MQQGVLGSALVGSYRPGGRGVPPRITGQAWIIGRSERVIDPTDPFVRGIGAAAAVPAGAVA